MARFFSGARNNAGSGKSTTSKFIREEIRKRGKVTPETYKRLLQQKLNDAKAEVKNKDRSSFSMFGKVVQKKREITKGAEKTLELLAQMEVEKALKKARQEIIIEDRRFTNGKIDTKGRIYDQMGNIVAQVNMKNGSMTTIYGQYIGMYKPKSHLVNTAITEAINKNSPFLINQRKVIEMQKNAASLTATLDVWSRTQTDVWGNAKSNVWGSSAVDVWGRTQMDSWGNQQIDRSGNQI